MFTITNTKEGDAMTRSGKEVRYKIGSDGYYERPTAFTYYLKNYRLRENLVIKALTREAMESMALWLAHSKLQMDQLSDKHNIPLPAKVKVQFEDEIREVKLPNR